MSIITIILTVFSIGIIFYNWIYWYYRLGWLVLLAAGLYFFQGPHQWLVPFGYIFIDSCIQSYYQRVVLKEKPNYLTMLFGKKDDGGDK